MGLTPGRSIPAGRGQARWSRCQDPAAVRHLEAEGRPATRGVHASPPELAGPFRTLRSRTPAKRVRKQDAGPTCPQPIDKPRFPIDTQDLRSMLDRIRCIRHACDLDLLLFFVRHPRALLNGEQLGANPGYGLEQTAASLDSLINAGLLQRSRSSSHAACLYVMEPDRLQAGPLASFLQIVATPEGRRSVMRLLESGSGRASIAGLSRRSAPAFAAAA
jgi:hypothetical protein